MADSLTDFRNASLRDFIESLPEVTSTSVEADQHVFRLMAAIDVFRFRDDDLFDFEDSDELPKNDAMREVVEMLTSPENSTLVYGYYGARVSGRNQSFC